ncbi:hypothetical protein COL940_013897 [Colletotrichum noveboracense]|nr:hypothetical protein COL940_013897 [Colletotrichum noveboracense]
MAAEDFVAVISGPEMFGDASLGTQHLIGASKWERIDEDKVIGHYQMRSTSVRLTGANSGEEKVEADRRVVLMQSYVKADGKWKLAGLKPMASSYGAHGISAMYKRSNLAWPQHGLVNQSHIDLLACSRFMFE